MNLLPVVDMMKVCESARGIESHDLLPRRVRLRRGFAVPNLLQGCIVVNTLRRNRLQEKKQ
jgi:hypothetical protein